ncbi:CLUMA_CG006369, isoform A [Clunio marinus]|uniref:CLUMA_CG006369, isoform A n=1 Tax=Clunio marinus TaxID=568069 RepID=A0A1J1HZU6_9DIPT|nr:CLUMA_CG006369, isoform A [Clunio marinus]
MNNQTGKFLLIDDKINIILNKFNLVQIKKNTSKTQNRLVLSEVEKGIYVLIAEENDEVLQNRQSRELNIDEILNVQVFQAKNLQLTDEDIDTPVKASR